MHVQSKKENLNLEKHRPSILLLESDPDICEVVEMILADEGYFCTGYLTRSRFMDKLATAKPDLLIINQGISLEGISLCRHLRSDLLLKEIPVIITSSARMKKVQLEGLCEGVLEKPFDIAALTSIVKVVLAQSAIKNERDVGCL